MNDFLQVTRNLIWLSLIAGCSKPPLPLEIDAITAGQRHFVKAYFHTTDANLDVEKNSLFCVPGEGKAEEFYQRPDSGVEASGLINFIKKLDNNSYYVADLHVSYYDKESNSWNGEKYELIRSLVNEKKKLSCRIVISRFYLGAPNLSDKAEVSSDKFLEHYLK